jgi:hypothetical protein
VLGKELADTFKVGRFPELDFQKARTSLKSFKPTTQESKLHEGLIAPRILDLVPSLAASSHQTSKPRLNPNRSDSPKIANPSPGPLARSKRTTKLLSPLVFGRGR